MRAYTIAKAFYKKFQRLGWGTDDQRPEWSEANCWIQSALYHTAGDPRVWETNLIVPQLRNAIRIRAREQNDAWEWYEARVEELRALETAARMLGKDVPQF